ncbi:MAG: protein-export chaperone SecB [Pseudomonadota bacterium]
MSEETAQESSFSVQRIYLKDASFEAPNSPMVFKQEWRPEISVDLRDSSRHLEGNLYDVVLTITVSAKIGATQAFLVEVHQGGIFALSEFSPDQLKFLLGSMCLNIIYPFARETISDIIVRGGFPQLLLAPVNFEALYLQRQKQNTEALV